MKRLALLAVVACGSSPAPTKPPAATDAIAIVDATVVPMDRDTALAHYTVIVRDGKIAAVGPTASTPVPDGARTIDGRGKWVIPGLVDSHVHTFDAQQLALFATLGVTTIRVLWGFPNALGTRDSMARGEQRLAPRIFTAGSIIDGKPTIWPGSTGVTTVEEAKSAVAEQHAAGYDFIKVYNLLPRAAYEAIVADAAKLGMKVIGHVPHEVGLADVLAAKQHTIEHLEGYTLATQRDDSPLRDATGFKARLGMFKHVDPAKLDAIVAKTKAAGTWNCPTLVVLDRITKFDQPLDQPEFRFVPKGMLATWDPKADFRFKSWTAEDFQLAREGNTWRHALVRKLVDAGAGVVAGTDVGNPRLVPGFSLHDELALLVAAKLTPFEALRAATSAPAQMLGVANEQGTVTAGMRADLVLLDGDPLADINNTKKISGVMLRGRWLPASELIAERERIAAIYAGTRSRFDGVEMPKTAAYAAQFRGGGPRESGEQRVWAQGNGNVATIFGEVRGDFGAPSRFEIDPGENGLGKRASVTADGLALVFTRDGETLKVSGTIGKAQITREFPVAADETLGGSPLALDQLSFRQLRSLAVGAKTTIKIAVLDTTPPSVEHLTLEATRLPDSSSTQPVRRFEIVVGRIKFEVGLDANGWLVEHPDHKRDR